MNPIFLEIGPISIRYYGMMYAVAFLVGLQIAFKFIKDRNEGKPESEKIDKKIVEDCLFVAMIGGLIGARIYYVALEWDYYGKHLGDLIAVWKGGMAIHGGIIGAALGTIIYSKMKKVSTLELSDAGIASLALGQAFGRIGNFMNGDAHGVPISTPFKVMLGNNFNEWWSGAKLNSDAFHTSLPWNWFGMTFPLGSPAGNEFPNLRIHPVMLYELVLNVVGFCLLWFVFRKKGLAKGSLTAIYLIQYAIIRSVVTIFRADDLELFGIRAPHLISIVMLITGIVGLYIFNKKSSSDSI